MEKKVIRILAVFLAAVMLLSGCGQIRLPFGEETRSISEDLKSWGAVPFSQMEYVRPDLQEMERMLDEISKLSQGKDWDSLIDSINAFYEAYDWFYTCYALADIHYSGNLKDTYWQEENNFCTDSAARVDAMLDELYRILAKSTMLKDLESEDNFGSGFFDSYQGESRWDDTLLDMMAEESRLENEYYTVSAEAADYEVGSKEYYDVCADEMTQILVELIALRQKIASHLGYSDYPTYAREQYFYRDYTLEQEKDLLEEIRRELVPLYRKSADSDAWNGLYASCSEKQVMQYVRTTAGNLGGKVAEAFSLMNRAGLYDIKYSANKYNASFEEYLPSYSEPFVFMNPQGTKTDCLTFAHEFGHFCNDYMVGGSYCGIDVTEFFSQGMEYLSLSYGEASDALIRGKLLDSLSTYVEQACYASFEREMYSLSGKDLSVEGVNKLYTRIAASYGFDSMEIDPRDFVTVTHFYTEPMYIISYVVSNDAAMQLYQMESEAPGSGAALYEANLDSAEQYFLQFVADAGLESPFKPGRIQELAELFADYL